MKPIKLSWKHLEVFFMVAILIVGIAALTRETPIQYMPAAQGMPIHAAAQGMPIHVAAIGGTEYWANETQQLMVQVTDIDGIPVNNANCNLTVFNPDTSIHLNGFMSNIPHSHGLYNLSLDNSTDSGVYSYNIECSYGGGVAYTANTYHVAPWAEAIRVIDMNTNDTNTSYIVTTIESGMDSAGTSIAIALMALIFIFLCIKTEEEPLKYLFLIFGILFIIMDIAIMADGISSGSVINILYSTMTIIIALLLFTTMYFLIKIVGGIVLRLVNKK